MFWFHIQEIVAKSSIMKLSPTVFSSKSFTVLGFMYRSLRHFKLIFVYSVKEGSNFILYHMDIQFSQHHLLERWVFSPLNGLETSVKTQ